MIGAVFGRLTVEHALLSVKGRAQWMCTCSCGMLHMASGDALKQGKITSCGCYRRSGDRWRTHGCTSGRTKSRAFRIWSGMKQRCDNPRASGFHRYGAKGVSYDPAWREFSAFYADMGDCPDGMSLDRIDNSKGYCKTNCRWATAVEQSTNRNTTHFFTQSGKTLSLSQWCRELNLQYARTYRRVVINGEPFPTAVEPTKRKTGKKTS
jgi:hypothetical protein